MARFLAEDKRPFIKLGSLYPKSPYWNFWGVRTFGRGTWGKMTNKARRRIPFQECLETVQHQFTRLFKDFKDLDYYARLRQLRLWSLEERRNRADLIEVFKLCKGLTSIPLERFSDLDTGGRTRGHSLKLRKPSCHTNVRKYFFSTRVINRWNSLASTIHEY